MKKIYNTPIAAFTALEMKDMLTASLTLETDNSGAEDSGEYGDLFGRI